MSIKKECDALIKILSNLKESEEHSPSYIMSLSATVSGMKRLHDKALKKMKINGRK